MRSGHPHQIIVYLTSFGEVGHGIGNSRIDLKSKYLDGQRLGLARAEKALVGRQLEY